MNPGCVGVSSVTGRNKLIGHMEACCSKFTAPEGGARLAAAAAERNTLAVEYSAFVSTRLLHEDAYKIRGLLSKGYQRSAYVTRASKVACVAYELHILTDLTMVQALQYADVEDWAGELEEKQVVVCTSQVLKCLLQDGLLTIPLLNVLIIDSCHLIFEDENLQYIMKCYKESKESEQPRILALTYPLFTSAKESEPANDNNTNNKGISKPETIANSVNETTDNSKETETDIKDIVDKDSKDENSEDTSANKDRVVESNDVKEVEDACEEIEEKRIVELNDMIVQDGVSDEIEEKRIVEITDDKENDMYMSNVKQIEKCRTEPVEANERNEKDDKKTSTDDKKDSESINKSIKKDDESEKKIDETADTIVEGETKDVQVTESKDMSEKDIVIKDVDSKAQDTDTHKIKEKEVVKSDDLKESLDDFDMYEKLEWKIEELEKALCCKMDLAEDIDGGKRLANTVAKPKEILIEYSPKPPVDSMPEAYAELEAFMRDAVVSAKAFMDEHRYDPTEIYGDDLYEEFMNIPDPTIEPKLMFDQFLYVLDQLGPYAADKAAFSLLVKLEKLKIKVPYERHFLLLCVCTSVFVKIRCQAELILSKYDDWDRIQMFSTPKVLRFAEILEQFQSPEQKEKTDSLNNKQLNEEGKCTEVNETSNGSSNTQEENSDVVANEQNKTEVEITKDSENIRNCERSASSNSNKSDNLANIEGSDCKTACEGNTNQNNPNDIEDTQNCDENNKHSPKGLVRSKTIELIDDLDKCDFVTLGNKIEDRVNTYEANLKDIDDIDVSYEYDLKSKKNDENECVNESKTRESKDNKLNESTSTVDKLSNNNTKNLKDTIESENTDDISKETKRTTSTKDTRIDNENTQSNSKLNETEAENSKIRNDDEDSKIAERQKLDPPDPKVLNLELKPKGLGFRRPHRVRGRGRVHRTHAARIQQMQQNPDALCGIVFVKEPLVAKIMFMIIVDMSRCRPSLSHLCAQYCAVESEGDDCRPRGKKHEDVLKKFRMHECNLLLATSALEEGIDLPRCNLVVRWDEPPSYRSHGLCRSRARASRSSVALLGEAPSERLLDNLSVYKELDQMISRKCGCGIQNEPPPSEEIYADVFTPIVKAYTPDEVKEDRKSNNNQKDMNTDNEKEKDKLTDNEKDTKKDLDSKNQAEKENRDGQADKVNIDENHSQNNSNEKCELTIDLNNDKASVNDELDDERIIVNMNEPAKEAINTNRDLKCDGQTNKALNIDNNKVNPNDINKVTDIPVDSNETRDSFKETSYNITYSFSKNCECKSDCKCKSVKGKSEVKSKVKGDEEFCSVDLSTAIALINRYCGKLPSDTFTRLAPQYWMEAVRLPDKRTGQLRPAYICTLRLPLNCPVKYNIVGHPMPTAVLARRMVALQACRILHRSGELDDQLMPIGKENFKAAELENVGQSDSETNDSARPGTTKRRQYYYKRTAAAFTDCQPIIDSTDTEIEENAWTDVQDSYKARFGPDVPHNTLYALSARLWCALPERYNTRGRRLHAPQAAPHAVAVLMAARANSSLHIPAFPVYTRSGEVRVAIERAPRADVRLSPARARLVRRFMRFVFSDVLRVRRRGMRLQPEGSTHNNYYIVPTVRVTAEDGTSYVDIDWAFLELIYKHTEEKKNSVEKPVILQQDDEEEEEVVEKKPKREREKDGKVKKMENPLLKPGEVFVFDADKYRDAVVTPWYRNRDQPQYFLVAEICWNLTPESAFPSATHGSFREYYSGKYGVSLTQPDQPLLDVDHTSARLNLLTPRYVNRKGVALPVSSERTRRAKRDRLDQKQILVPELCAVHPFAAPLWFATVALPCVLYRINALLIADEIRRSVGADVAVGAPVGAPPPQWPPLDFGWSLAEVLNTEEKGEKGERKKEDDDGSTEETECQQEEKDSTKEERDEDTTVEAREKTINDILQEKEDAESGFEIGTWSNDMASSIPPAQHELLPPLPPNLTFCTSASGGANWSEPIEKTKMTFGATKTFSVAESDCSYMSSDFDTDDSDLNSEGTDEETDSSGICSKNSYAAMGVRIEYKTAHEAEAVDLERTTRVNTAPQPDAADERADRAALRRIVRAGEAPVEHIEKYRKSVAIHKENIRKSNIIAKDEAVKDILPDNSKELERIRKNLHILLKNKKLFAHVITDSLNEKDNESVINNIIVKGEVNYINGIITKSKADSKDNETNNVINNNNCEEVKPNFTTEREALNIKTEWKLQNIDNKLIEDNTVTKELIEENLSDEVTVNFTIDSKELNIETEVVNELKLQNVDSKVIDDNSLPKEVMSENLKNEVNTVTNAEIESLVPNTDEINDCSANLSKSDEDLAKELLHEMFPYGLDLDIDNGQVTLESIEKNKRILLEKFKKTISEEEVKKMNCFSMLDIDIDSPDYVNDKVVNVGFDTKENYINKVNGFRNPKEYTPYYQDGKAQNGKEFDFDYQPDLEQHPGPSPSVILQALTMSNANDGINLERLETIGDSFLKFAITAYLYCAHPAVHEGKLSHMRSKQVSNLNLYRLGRNKRLGARMIASKFEPHDNWLPPCHRPPPTHHPATGDQEMQMHKEAALDNAGCFIPYNLITQHSIPDKSIADCVEALIGAYLLETGPRGALLFMSWLGISVLPRHSLPLPADHPYVVASKEGTQKPPPPPSPKQSYPSSISCSDSEELSDDEAGEESEPGADCDWGWRGRPVGSLRPRLGDDGVWYQTVYGELRAPPSPLLRYVEDPEGELERMLSGYEALERTLQYRFRDRSLLLQALTHASHHQNRLTDCYQRLEFLGDAILDYLITRHLYEDARRHSPGALTDLRSALVNNTIFATLAAKHGFHRYFRHMSPGLNEVLTKYVKIQEENGHSISEEHYLIQEDELEQAEDVEVPKALGDLFESVAGAIFLDSGMSLGAVWASYVRLMGAELEAFSAAAPKSPVRELLEAEPDTAKFGKPERLADGRRVRVCVEVFGRGAFKGIGRNYRIAKGTAARCALRHLRGTRPAKR